MTAAIPFRPVTRMTRRLERLVYRSRIAPGLDEAIDFGRIFDTAVRWNRDHGICGVLAFNGETFVQVIEGRPDRVDELLGRLSRDPRHSDIRVLARWPIVAPMFDDWSMARADVAKMSDRSLKMLFVDGTGVELAGILYDLASVGSSPRRFRV